MSYEYDGDCSTLLLQTMSFLLRAQQQQLEQQDDKPAAGAATFSTQECQGSELANENESRRSDQIPPTLEVTPDIKHYMEPAPEKGSSATWSSSDGQRNLRRVSMYRYGQYGRTYLGTYGT